MSVQQMEDELCKLFAEILGLPEVEPQDSFFDLGGHSLTASKLVRRIGTDYGIKVPLRRLYVAPTAQSLAQRLTAS